MKIFLDGANFEMMKKTNNGIVSGYTTNPSLMKKEGITNYTEFIEMVLGEIDLPVSFEVFSDDICEMKRQALVLNSYGHNVYVKIPITNTKGISTIDLVGELIAEGVNVNLTAVFKMEQIYFLKNVLEKNVPFIISVFAGRIADTGVDPMPIITNIVNEFSECDKWEVLWASTREVLNFYQAKKVGCDIITMPFYLLEKMKMKNKNLNEFSLETVREFYDDSVEAGYVV